MALFCPCGIQKDAESSYSYCPYNTFRITITAPNLKRGLYDLHTSGFSSESKNWVKNQKKVFENSEKFNSESQMEKLNLIGNTASINICKNIYVKKYIHVYQKSLIKQIKCIIFLRNYSTLIIIN